VGRVVQTAGNLLSFLLGNTPIILNLYGLCGKALNSKPFPPCSFTSYYVNMKVFSPIHNVMFLFHWILAAKHEIKAE